jgi:hypothetical protein
MAKGWESKSVESQVQDFEEEDRDGLKKIVSAAEMELQRRRKVLELSRLHVEKDLQNSQNPRYRDQLIRALADLDAQLQDLPPATLPRK